MRVVNAVLLGLVLGSPALAQPPAGPPGGLRPAAGVSLDSRRLAGMGGADRATAAASMGRAMMQQQSQARLLERRDDVAPRVRPNPAEQQRPQPGWLPSAADSRRQSTGEPATPPFGPMVPSGSVAQQQLRRRLAELDRLRDEALERGDVRLLADIQREERLMRGQPETQSMPSAGPVAAHSAEEPLMLYGPGNGLLTAAEARTYGRQFGQSVAEHSRQQLAWPQPPGAVDPATGQPLPWGPGFGRLTAHPWGEAQPLAPPDDSLLPPRGAFDPRLQPLPAAVPLP